VRVCVRVRVHVRVRVIRICCEVIFRPALLRRLCVLQGIHILNYLIAILPEAYGQCCATTPSFGYFDRLYGAYRICTVQDGASTVCWNHRPLGLWFLLVGELDRVCKRATRGT